MGAYVKMAFIGTEKLALSGLSMPVFALCSYFSVWVLAEWFCLCPVCVPLFNFHSSTRLQKKSVFFNRIFHSYIVIFCFVITALFFILSYFILFF